jgi:hypothetical protein
MEIVRTLPLRVEFGAGEALDSWLLRLADRNGLGLSRLGRCLGGRLRVWHNHTLTWKLPETLLRRVETQVGLPGDALDAAVLDQFDPLGWRPIPGSRFCPDCLSDTGGRWPIRWQLPYTFACLLHGRLLQTHCPGCQRAPRSRIAERAGLDAPTRCALGPSPGGEPCTLDLRTATSHPLDLADSRLAAQAWVDARLKRLDQAVVTELRDLDALAAWFLQRIDPADLDDLDTATVAALHTYREQGHGIKRPQPTARLIAAAMSCRAIAVLDADDHDRPAALAPLLRDVHTRYRQGQTPSPRGPMILSRKRLTSLSDTMQSIVLRSLDGHLPISERLRYRTCTAAPRPPVPGSLAADRARYLPQALWPDWVMRFLPPTGAYATDVARDIPSALLLPGNPARNNRATSELTGWRQHHPLPE